MATIREVKKELRHREWAEEIAVRIVREFRKSHDIQVIFNVFKEDDHEIYKRLLGGN